MHITVGVCVCMSMGNRAHRAQLCGGHNNEMLDFYSYVINNHSDNIPQSILAIAGIKCGFHRPPIAICDDFVEGNDKTSCGGKMA